MRLSDFKVLTFDCYGTLIDWESGMLAALAPLIASAERRTGSALGRDAVLEAHARLEAAAQIETPTEPYRAILAVVYRRLAEAWGVPASRQDCESYGHSVGRWPAFADSAAALAQLKQHVALAILSNVDKASFARSNTSLGVIFDAVYTAEDICSYKPDPRNFAYMLDHLRLRGFAHEDILHVAESLYHDHVPAKAAGLATCWIHRRHDQQGFGATLDPGTRPCPDFTFRSLAELAAAHRADMSRSPGL